MNLHRAKVEEVEVEPPAAKRRCVRARRLSEDSDFAEPSTSSSSHSLSRLNSNSSMSEDRNALEHTRTFVNDHPSAVTESPCSSRVYDSSGSEPCCSSTSVRSTHSVSRSVQTDPEPRRELKLPENGVSMKRKAVMEAISEILKKMYASSEKGRLPGSFKGRFSSEFTCDSDMREILHSKTTMTSYGTDLEDDKNGGGEGDGQPPSRENVMSKAKLEENEQMRDKVAHLKWRMQQSRALKRAKRKGERSPCGWMEALNCDMPDEQPRTRDRTGFCGFKRGFLLAD